VNIKLKSSFAQQLFNNIPNNVVDKWGLKNPKKDSGIFRFKKQKLSAVYYQVNSGPGGVAIIKYSFPNFKFEYIYKLWRGLDSMGRQIEKRYDKEGNIESEYVRKPEGLFIKTKSKDKEVYLPYIWGRGSRPLNNINELSLYLVKSHIQFKWFHKEGDLEDIYIIPQSTYSKNNQ
jgi:hypothetical protein